MVCDACGNPEARRLRYRLSGGQCCDRCGSLSNYSVPDVYFAGPYRDPNLVDVRKPQHRDGTWIESRRQKADLMARLGVMEAGDKRHGMRLEDRHAIKREQERGR